MLCRYQGDQPVYYPAEGLHASPGTVADWPDPPPGWAPAGDQHDGQEVNDAGAEGH